jgi:hypothetical protein
MRDERRSSLGARVSVVIKRSAWGGGLRDERKSSLGARVLVVIRRSNLWLRLELEEETTIVMV